MKKYSVLFTISLALFSVQLKAQDSLIVSDLHVLFTQATDSLQKMQQMMPLNNHQAVGQQSAAPPKFDLAAYFSVNKPASVSEIYIKLGASPNGTNVKNETFTVVHEGGLNKVMSGTMEVARFYGESTSYKAKIQAAEKTNAKWITVYVKHTDGSFSQKKYFNLNN